MNSLQRKGFVLPLMAAGVLSATGFLGGGCSSEDDTELVTPPTSDAGKGGSTGKGGNTGYGGNAGGSACGTSEACSKDSECWQLTCNCASGEKIDVPATCRKGCCLELAEACNEVCPASGTGGSSGQGGSTGQGGSAQGGAAGDGGSSSGGASGTGGTSQGGASGEGGSSQGGASGTGGTSQGGASGEGGSSQGGAAGTGGSAQGGSSGEGGSSSGGASGTGGSSQGGASGQGGTSQGGASGQGGSAGGGGAPVGLVINEVDYDQPGEDNGEFVELLNTSASPISLDGLAVLLVNASASTVYGKSPIALSGTLNPGAYLLLHSTVFTPPSGCALTVSLGTAQNSLQNGAPDAVVVIRVADNTVIDAVSYEGTTTAITYSGASVACTEGTGVPATESDLDELGSVSRLPNGTDTNDNSADFKFTTTPTPCKANVP